MNVLAIAANVQVLGLFFGFWGGQFINYVHKRPFAIISETLSFVFRNSLRFADKECFWRSLTCVGQRAFQIHR